MNERRVGGKSKNDWLEAGLDVLGTASVAEISVEALARRLGIAKSGFYWHFKDRRDYLSQLLDHWYREVIEVIAENDQINELEPVTRLITAVEMIFRHDLVKYELALHQWATTDKLADKVVRKANRVRLEYVKGIFAELGFTKEEIEIRSMLALTYQLWEETTLKRIVSRKRRKELIRRRIRFLTSK
jgi:AcrR family transcriptional regulator